MKKLFGILFLLTFSPPLVFAEIQLEWEYTVGSNDFSPIADTPDPLNLPQYGIRRIKVGASGHTLVLLERFYMAPYQDGDTEPTSPNESRLAMFDPQGNRIFLSDKLSSTLDITPIGMTPDIRILNISPDSASLLIESNPFPEKNVNLINQY